MVRRRLRSARARSRAQLTSITPARSRGTTNMVRRMPSRRTSVRVVVERMLELLDHGLGAAGPGRQHHGGGIRRVQPDQVPGRSLHRRGWPAEVVTTAESGSPFVIVEATAHALSPAGGLRGTAGGSCRRRAGPPARGARARGRHVLGGVQLGHQQAPVGEDLGAGVDGLDRGLPQGRPLRWTGEDHVEGLPGPADEAEGIARRPHSPGRRSPACSDWPGCHPGPGGPARRRWPRGPPGSGPRGPRRRCPRTGRGTARPGCRGRGC